MHKTFGRTLVSVVVLIVTFGAFSIAASAALAPEIDDALASYSVTSPAPLAAPTPCAGLDSPHQYVTSRSTATGTSTETSTGGRFSLSGNVTIKSIDTVQLNFSGLSHGVATGSFLMTYPSDTKHRLKGTFQGVVRLDASTQNSYGRGFILASYQKKSATGWASTGDVLFANTTFAGVQNDDGSSTITGSIGSSTDFAAAPGAPNNWAEKAVSACP